MDSIKLDNVSDGLRFPQTADADQSIGQGPTTPKWMFIVYHLPILLQVSLLHQRFQSKNSKYHSLFRIIRIILIPINIWISLQIMYKFTLYPLTQRGPLNLQFGCWIVHLIMKSIEWGLISTFDGDPTFQLRPEFQPPDHHHHRPSSKKFAAAQDQHPDDDPALPNPSVIDYGKQSELTTPSTLTTTGTDSLKDILIWSFHHVTSFRGINYHWGWKGRQVKRPTVSGTIQSLLFHNLIQTIGLVGCVLSRDYGSPLEAILSLGVPNFPGLWLIAEGLSCLSWGLLCTSGMEFAFCPLVLMSIGIDSIRTSRYSTFFRPFLSDSFFDWWDPRLFVPLFDSPLTAKSLASLWSHHWHQIYRRSFIFLGILPASRLSAKLGLSLKAQRVFALFGGFLVSAILHELTLSFLAQPAHPAPHRFMSTISGSFVYFMVQPIGIMVEPYVIKRIPSWLGGGSTWVLLFTLITARAFKNEYILHHRVIDHTYPPFNQWPLWTLLWPPAIMNL